MDEGYSLRRLGINRLSVARDNLKIEGKMEEGSDSAKIFHIYYLALAALIIAVYATMLVSLFDIHY